MCLSDSREKARRCSKGNRSTVPAGMAHSHASVRSPIPRCSEPNLDGPPLSPVLAPVARRLLSGFRRHEGNNPKHRRVNMVQLGSQVTGAYEAFG
jgi:hypothetical protein